MKARLTKDMRIKHKAGEIVEVSPADYNFLLSVRAAEPVKDPEPKKKGTKKK